MGSIGSEFSDPSESSRGVGSAEVHLPDQPRVFVVDPMVAWSIRLLGVLLSPLALGMLTASFLSDHLFARMLTGFVPLFGVVGWGRILNMRRLSERVFLTSDGIQVVGHRGQPGLRWEDAKRLEFFGSWSALTWRFWLTSGSGSADLLVDTWYRDTDDLVREILRRAPGLAEGATGYSGERVSWLVPYQALLRIAGLLTAGALLAGVVFGDYEIAVLYASLALTGLVIPGLVVTASLPFSVREVRVDEESIELVHFGGRRSRVTFQDIQRVDVENWITRKGLRNHYPVLALTRSDGSKVLLSSGVCRDFGSCFHRVHELWQASRASRASGDAGHR